MKEYREIFRVSLEYVLELSDAGMYQAYHGDDYGVEKDDLRLAFILSGGHELLLQGKQRFYILENELIIEDLWDADRKN